jgi:hypothetical protein
MRLTKRQREILQRMADDPDGEDGELVYERGIAYLGLERIAARTVNALIRLYAISVSDFESIGKYERWHINETGRQLLEAEQGR